MASHTKQIKDEVSERASEGMDSLRTSASQVGRHVRDAIEDAVEQGKTTSQHLRRRLAGTTHYLADRGRDGLEYTEACIRNHALLSTLTAFGAGLVLARLLFRR